MNRFGILAIAIFCLADPALAQLFPDGNRSWVSRDGRNRVIGSLTALSDDHLTVTLTRSDNQKKVQVPVGLLSALDYLYVCDYARRASSGNPNHEFGLLPLAMRGGEKTTDRWHLSPAITMHLPPGTVIWRLISSQPMFYGAFAADDDRLPDLTVLFEPALIEQNDRLKRIQEQNEATIRFLEERGVNSPMGLPLLEDVTASFQKSVMTGTDSNEQEFSCETHLRFDYQGMLVFRAYGSAERVKEMIATIDDFRYLDSDETASSATGTATVSTLAAEIPSRIPADIYNEFEAFREQAIALLTRSNNAKEVLERLSEPNGLSILKGNPDRWDSAVISFDVRKRLRLKTTLQTLDWTSATYSAEDRTIVFSLPDEIRFVRTEQGWKIINRHP